jgi:adenylate cyclase
MFLARRPHGASRATVVDPDGAVCALVHIDNAPWFAAFLGNSYYLLHRYDEAITAYQEAVRRNPDVAWTHSNLAMVYAEMGKDTGARAQAAEVMRINPGGSVNWVRDNYPLKNQADLNRMVAALQKAGPK